LANKLAAGNKRGRNSCELTRVEINDFLIRFNSGDVAASAALGPPFMISTFIL